MYEARSTSTSTCTSPDKAKLTSPMQERDAGRDDLAGKVEQVSETVGDGLGYDVLSFEAANSSKKLVEVKTTVWGKSYPFFVTETERRCSEAMVAQFYLFRIFHFARSPGLYVLQGSSREKCMLAP